MKKIKSLLLLVLVLLLTFGIVSCGEETGDDDPDFGDVSLLIEKAAQNTKKSSSASIVKTGTPNFDVPDVGYDGSKVTLTFYHTMGSNLSDVLDLYIADFNKLYPNITIEWQQVGNYDDVRNQITTEIAAGSHPDIAYCYPDHVALYNLANMVVTLDNLIDSKITVQRDAAGAAELGVADTEILGLTDEQKADFIEGYYAEGQQFGDGLMYTMPFSKSTEVLYYNKTFFDEHGLSVPDHWFTTGENDTTSLEYVCAKIKEIDPNCIPLGYDSESNWFITMCEQIGSDYTSAEDGGQYLFDNDYNKIFVKKFREWAANGYVTTQNLYGSYTSGLFITTAADETKSYMSIGSSAGATHQRPTKEDTGYPFEVGIASIPQMNQDNPKVISQGPSVCIFKNSNPQKVIASWLFVKYLTTSIEFQAEFSMVSGYVPVLKSVAENEIYSLFISKADGGDYIAALSAKVCLEQESAYYTSPAFNGSSTARDKVGSIITNALSIANTQPNKFINELFKEAVKECEE